MAVCLEYSNAQTQLTWSTTSANGAMTNGANWQGGVAPSTGDSWLFTNSSVYTLTNGFTGYTVSGITFANYTGSAYTMSGNAFTLTGGITNNSIYNQTISNALTINSAVTITNTANSSAAYVTLRGALSGGGSLSFGSFNSGSRLQLYGSLADFNGAIVTTSGRVNIGAAAVAGSNADFTFNNSSGVFLEGSSTTYRFGSLSGSSLITGNGTASTNNTIEVGAKNASTIYSGIIGRTSTGSAWEINLSKVGTGTLTLTANNNYLGTTTISNGVLQIGAGGTTGSISNTASINIAGGSLAFNRSDNITQGVNFLTNGSAISGAGGGLIKMGSGTLSLTAANTYSGSTRVDAGKLVLSNALAIQNSAFDTDSAGILSLASGITTPTLGGLIGNGAFAPENYNSVTALALNTATGANLTYSGVIGNGAAGMTLTKNGAGTQILSGNNSYSGGTTLNAGTLGVGNSSALGSGDLTVDGNSTLLAAADALTLANDASLNSGTLTVDAQSFNLTSSGAITGTGALNKIGAGSLNLIGANSYSGGTLVSVGTLSGNTTGLQGNITNNAAVVFDQSSTGIYGDVLSGNGVLTKLGVGTVILSGGNTQSGGTLISAGTLQVGAGGTTGSLAGAITNNATLAFNRSDNLTQSTAISGSGNLTKAGNGTLTLSGNNTYTGKTAVTGGTIFINADSRLGTAPTTFVADQLTLDGGTLAVANAVSFNTNRGITLAAGGGALDVEATGSLAAGAGLVISGTGALTKNGTGTVSFSAANIYSGGTIVNAGTVRVGMNSVTNNSGGINSSALGVGELTLQDNVKITTTGGANISVYVPKINLNGNINLNESTGSGSGALLFSGTWDLGGGSRTINVQRTNSLVGNPYQGLQFAQPNSSFSAPKIENGALTLSTTTGTTNSTAQVIFNTTTFSANTALTVDDGVMILSASGSFFAAGSNAPSLNLAADSVRGGGILQLGYGASGGAAVVRNAEVYSLSGGGLITASNATNGTANTGTLTINNGSNANFNGTITDGGANGFIRFVKTGAGKQILSGTNSYTGTTTVSGGTLIINGDNSAATGNLTVSSGATLGGSGIIGGATTISGIHSPGNSPGLQTFTSDLTYNNGSSIVWELDQNTLAGRGSNFDGIDVAGDLTFNGPVSFNLLFNALGSTVTWTDSLWGSDYLGTSGWLVYSLTGEGQINNFNNLSLVSIDWLDSATNRISSVRSGASFSLYQDGNDIYLNYTAVPEPSTYAMLVLSGLAMAGYVIRRRHRHGDR